MTTKFPDQLYLTFKAQRHWDGEKHIDLSIPLAFAHVYEPTKKGWDKKKQTQCTWAYGDYEEREDGIWLKECRQWEDWGTPDRKIIDVPARRVPEHLQPHVFENESASGFKISKSVHRYSTSNKLWRIEDPRGFELEITTSNMEEILMQGGVLKGEIQGELCWATGKMLRYTS